MNRRDLLGAGLALSGAAFVGRTARAAARPFFAAHDLPIGVQLYTLDPDLDRDFDGTLAKLARIGFRSVEMAGFHGRSAAELKRAFDAHGLTCTSAHIQPVDRGNGPSFANHDALIRAMHVIGVTDVVLPIPLFPTDFRPPAETNAGDAFRASGKAMLLDDWHRTAAFLNAQAKALAPHGLRVGYHNHNFSFAPAGGSTGFDILLAETDPKTVAFEMDVGWVAAAGKDPIALLKAHPGRFTQMHVKDIKPSTRPNFEARQDPTEVGSGKIAWPQILPVAYAAGVRHFYVEQEPPFPGSRIASVAKSYRYLATVAAA
ncbi:MAG: sugar phosphate isomerase/epimerase family protein [Sphingomonas sp.]